MIVDDVQMFDTTAASAPAASDWLVTSTSHLEPALMMTERHSPSVPLPSVFATWGRRGWHCSDLTVRSLIIFVGRSKQASYATYKCGRLPCAVDVRLTLSPAHSLATIAMAPPLRTWLALAMLLRSALAQTITASMWTGVDTDMYGTSAVNMSVSTGNDRVSLAAIIPLTTRAGIDIPVRWEMDVDTHTT